MYADMSPVDLAWFCGLFEGEGTFVISKGRACRIAISMTDLDILGRVESLLGGSIHDANRSDVREHWKQAWVWTLSYRPSLELIPLMLPYLGARRAARAEEFLRLGISKTASISNKDLRIKERHQEIKNLYASGEYTHKELAEKFSLHRTTVSHILRGRFDR